MPPAEQAFSPALVGLAAAGFACAALISLADAVVMSHVIEDHQWWLLQFMARLTDVGQSQWYLVPATLVFLSVGMVDWSAQGRRGRMLLQAAFGQAGYAFVAIAAAGITGDIVKLIVGRSRPMDFSTYGAFHFSPFTYGYEFASFPSGHSTTMGAAAGILMIWFPRATLPALLVPLFFASCRVASYSHYPSDVAAGFMLGLVTALWLARWLGARHTVFRLIPGRLLPRLRNGHGPRAA